MFKEYLGDGVYVEFDDIVTGIWLTTENGVRTTNKIFLEESVYGNLKQYIKLLPERIKTNKLTSNKTTNNKTTTN